MRRYSLSIGKLYSHSKEKAFEGEYDTLDEVNTKLDEVINNYINEGLYTDKNDFLYNNGVKIYDNKYEVSVFKNC